LELKTLEYGPNKSLPDPIPVVENVSFDAHLHCAALVDAFDDPIISKDLAGRILGWNQAAARVFGYQANEIVGRSILQLIPPNCHNEEKERLQKLRADEPIEPYETKWLRKDGGNVDVFVTIYPVRNQAGTVVGASKVASDLSDRTRNEENGFRLAAIVDSADDAIISKDLNGIVTSWNGAAQLLFGYTAEDMIGQPILRLIPEELHYEETEILRRLRAGERVDHYETTRRKKSGESIEVSVTISPITDASGRVTGASKIARNISDRKRIERLLIQSEKLAATGRMAATIAHEINNPLESVMNLIFLARQHSEPSGKVHQYLVTAEEELERVSHIARQTLGYYRDTSSPVEVHLHDLIENVLSVYHSKLLSSGISVDTRFNDLQKIRVSKGEMLQVFTNVIANSIDAMRQGGSLKISIRKLIGSSGDGIQTVIQDSGTGIEQKHLENIFEPFFTTKGDLGTGIGLWVARQLVERRGGQIAVATSTEHGNSGTTLTIFIPFATPASRLGAERE
jgi:PAS domain S-box-containing protein